jgi:iron complex outermembrane receptor protein
MHVNIHIKRYLALVILHFVAPFIALPQASVTGRVVDGETGEALSGAHVIVTCTGIGAVTDHDGTFVIADLPDSSAVLQASHLGYSPVLKTISFFEGSHKEIIFNLVPQAYTTLQTTITANRISVLRNISPSTVSVIERQAIEQSGESNVLPVVGEQTPGVFVTERGVTGFGVASGAAGQVTIRGIGGRPTTRVLVLIDGHPQFMGIFGHPLPDAYVASDAEKVEVLRGPASILYGSNAMGGVLNIITRKQTDTGFSALVRASYGSYETQKYNAIMGYRSPKLEIVGSVNHDQTIGHRDNAEFRITNGFLKAGFKISEHFTISGDMSIAGFNSTDPGPIGTTDTTYRTDPHWQDIIRGYSSVRIENRFPGTEGGIQLYLNWGKHELNDGFHSRDFNYGLMVYQGMKLFKGSLITAGLDLTKYGGLAENIRTFPTYKIADTALHEGGVYILAQQQIREKIAVTAGIRAHYHMKYGMEWVPQAGLTCSPSAQTRIKANISKGFRSPSIQELFLFKTANPSLHAEHLWSYELGVLRWFFQERLALEFDGFYSHGDNLIESNYSGTEVSFKNTGSFEHYGIEFSGRLILNPMFSLRANYAWLHCDKPTLSAPGHSLFAEPCFRYKNLLISICMQYIQGLFITTEPALSEEYILLNAYASIDVTHFLSLFTSLRNILDQAYSINSGYPMPGFTIIGGLQLKIDPKHK